MKDMIDAEIQAKGLSAPRVTMQDLENEIASEHYFTAGEGIAGHSIRRTSIEPSPLTLELLTFCVLVLKNGFSVTGQSACVSPENFDEGIGRKIAREKAIDQLWPLLGFRLADQLSRPKPVPALVEEMVAVPADGYAGRPVELGDQVRFFERVNTTESVPMVAFVSAVLADNRVGLSVIAPNGTLHARESVVLLRHGETPASDLAYYARQH